MSNPFDQMAGIPYRGYPVHHELGKLSLKKFVKKSLNPKEHLKFAKKATKKTAQAVKKVAKTPLGKVAIIAGASMVLGPVVGTAVKAIGAKVGTLKAAGTIAKVGNAVVKSKAVPKIAGFAVQQKLSKNAQKKQLELQKQIYNTQNPLNPLPAKTKKGKKKKGQITAPPPDMVNALVQNAEQTAQLNNQIANDPQFTATVNNMLAQGATPQQVTDAWASSAQFAKVATPQIAQTILPQIRQSLEAQGLAPADAMMQAQYIANQTAQNTVSDIQSHAQGIPTWVYAAGAGVVLLMFMNRR